jgi:ferredoxin
MKVNITINDARLTVEKGLTILQAARENNIDIPTLCDYPGLPPHGSCRMCVIEIKGNPTFPTACTTPIEEGMVVFTDSPPYKLPVLPGERKLRRLHGHSAQGKRDIRVPLVPKRPAMRAAKPGRQTRFGTDRLPTPLPWTESL